MSANRPRLTEAEGPPELDPALGVSTLEGEWADASGRLFAHGASLGVAPPRNAPPTTSHAFRLVVTSHTPGGGQRAALTTAALGGGRLGAASDACQGGTAGPRRRASLCRPDVEWRRGVSATACIYLSARACIYLSIYLPGRHLRGPGGRGSGNAALEPRGPPCAQWEGASSRGEGGSAATRTTGVAWLAGFCSATARTARLAILARHRTRR